MNTKDFKVGQTVFVELIGNLVKGKKLPEECIEEWKITSVGKKYITANKSNNRWTEVAFEYRESIGKFVQKTKYSPDYVLYETRKEIEDKHERSRLFREISEIFTAYGVGRKLTLEKLRKIKEILDTGNDS